MAPGPAFTCEGIGLPPRAGRVEVMNTYPIHTADTAPDGSKEALLLGLRQAFGLIRRVRPVSADNGCK